MVRVIARACEEAIRRPDTDVVMPFRSRELHITPAAVAAAVESARQRVPSFAAARLRFRDLLARHAYDLFTRGDLLALSGEEFSQMLSADRDARAALDGLWRPVNPTALVRRLLTSRAALARAADGILNADEQHALLRPSARKGEPDPWTAADLPLLDEAEAFVKGETRRYGHVVVDEAQDLSAMALRMVARRAIGASLTVLGDLAQATGAGASRSWVDALEHLGSPEQVRMAELTIGYRLPAAILDYANRLLPEAAPHVTAAVSAREEGEPPELHAVTSQNLAATVVGLAGALSREFTTTAVIAPVGMLDDLRAELGGGGSCRAVAGGLDHLASPLAPARFAREGPRVRRGARRRAGRDRGRVGARHPAVVRCPHPAGAAPPDRARPSVAHGARGALRRGGPGWAMIWGWTTHRSCEPSACSCDGGAARIASRSPR